MFLEQIFTDYIPTKTGKDISRLKRMFYNVFDAIVSPDFPL